MEACILRWKGNSYNLCSILKVTTNVCKRVKTKGGKNKFCPYLSGCRADSTKISTITSRVPSGNGKLASTSLKSRTKAKQRFKSYSGLCWQQENILISQVEIKGQKKLFFSWVKAPSPSLIPQQCWRNHSSKRKVQDHCKRQNCCYTGCTGQGGVFYQTLFVCLVRSYLLVLSIGKTVFPTPQPTCTEMLCFKRTRTVRKH